MEKEIDWLKYRGNVMGFGDFCKMNERMDMEIKSTSEADFYPSHDDVLNAVGNVIEQVSGWDMEVFKKYVAEQLCKDKASRKDIVHWIMFEVNKYIQAEINIKGEEYIKKDKRDKLAFELIELDYAMIVEKLMRKLRGLSEDDMPTPIYIKQMVDICKDYIMDDEEEEE